MNKREYAEYLETPHWKSRRQTALKGAGYRCQLCGDHSARLEVHHNDYSRLGDEADSDLIVLCESCHGRFHGDDKSGVLNGCAVAIRSAEDHRALLLQAMVAVCDGRMSVPQANALVGLSAEVHKSIRQQWDMLVYAADNLTLDPGNRLARIGSAEGGENEE